MYIVQVSVCAQGVYGELLSYRSAQPCMAGDLVRVSFRKKPAVAVVCSCVPLSLARSTVRKSSFAVHAIDSVACSQFISARAMQALEQIACFYAIFPLRLLASVTSLAYTKSFAKYGTAVSTQKEASGAANDLSSFSYQVYSLDYHDRIIAYAKQIHAFPHYAVPAIIVCPTKEKAIQVANDLQKIVSSAVTVVPLYSKTYAKKDFAFTAKAERIVFCVTPSTFLHAFSAVPATLICEDENHPLYASAMYPFIDTRFCLYQLARELQIPYIVAGFPCSTYAYTSWGTANEQTYKPLVGDLLSATPSSVFVQAYARDTALVKAKEFSTLLPLCVKALKHAIQANQSVFIVVSRHGYASSIVCNDCKSFMQCTQCGSPLVLKNRLQYAQKSTQKKIHLTCITCTTNSEAVDRCPTCDGYSLVPLGIGIERVAEEAIQQFGRDSVYVRNQKTGSLKQVTSGVTFDFSKHAHGSVCIGTIYDLEACGALFDHVCIASHEAILATPVRSVFDYQEYVASTVRRYTAHTIHVQVNHTQSDIRAYSGSQMAQRVTQYISDAYQFTLPPAIAVTVMTLCPKHMFERVQKTYETILASNELSANQYAYDNTWCMTVTGFTSQDELLSWICTSDTLLQRLALKIYYIPYPHALRYSVRRR